VSKDNLNLGKLAEEKAREFLKANGYKIVCRNFKTKLGEIDIIARDKDTLCFVEVKCRSSDRFGSGFEAVGKLKQKQISKAALLYLKENKLLDKKARFDVVSLDYSGNKETIGLVKDAFELEERFIY
jgi:putative endonuclease